MEGNIAATYTLIYDFLKKQSKIKAADAVKKAAKDIVVLKDDIELDGPSLDEIVKQWKAQKNMPKLEEPDSSSEQSSDDSSSDSESGASSSSSSGSSSSSDSENGDDDGEPKAKLSIPAKRTNGRDTSTTLSSAEEKKISKRSGKTPRSTKNASDSKSSASENSTSESSSGDSSSSNSSSPAAASSSSGASSSDSESEDDGSKAQNAKHIVSSASAPKTSTATLVSDESTRVTKKRKVSETGAAAVTAIVRDSNEKGEIGAKPSNENGKAPRKVNERFQRIKPLDSSTAFVLDNGYEAKGGKTNDYGQRAHHDLIATRGAGFRKEKNKKKRGSYRGGKITLESHEIKFDY